MAISIKLTLIGLLVTTIFTGCNSEVVNENPPVKKEIKYVSIEEVPEQKVGPSASVIKQFKYIYEDDTVKYPLEENILMEQFLGNKSLLALDTRDLDESLHIVNYLHEDALWHIESILTLNYGEEIYETNKGGLNLPFEEFKVVTYHAEDYSQWAFGEEGNFVIITKYYGTPPIDESSYTKEMLSNSDREILISKHNNSILYVDSSSLIMVAGNLTNHEMIELVESLPDIKFSSFP